MRLVVVVLMLFHKGMRCVVVIEGKVHLQKRFCLHKVLELKIKTLFSLVSNSW